LDAQRLTLRLAVVCVVQEITSEDKVRLLMIYAATHPEKLDATKRMQWMKVRTVFL
jgi:hypothetical protein